MTKRLIKTLPISLNIILMLIIVSQAAVGQKSPQPVDAPEARSAQKADKTISTNPTDQPGSQRSVARGVVFIDVDNDGRCSDADMRFAGVRVSNGKDIVSTDPQGRYELPLDDQQIIFVIKPNGFRTALDMNNLPRFFYIHKPDGSPKLRFPGSEKTGPIPRSIDFPLYRQTEPEEFRVLLFGDTQPRNQTEVNYITEDVISDLVGSSAAFGVTLGDVVFDDLAIFEPLNQSIALIGIPWYNVIGNHDLNLDAPNRDLVNETFERIYGPTYYSFDYGQVHFIVLDNIDWIPALGDQGATYKGRFGETQLAWVQKDLSQIPQNQMVVLMMHIPIKGIEDCQDLYRLIENRPLCISISGHLHHHEHQFLTQQDGWKGKKPHHHLINVTVCGSWWSGQKDERGIPHTTMADGAPNGHSVLSFDAVGNYRFEFKAAGRPLQEQMGIRLPSEIKTNETGQTDVWVNVYNGNEFSNVRMQIGGMTDWIQLERSLSIDPYYQRLFDLEQNIQPPIEPKLTSPKPSTHLWSAKLPASLPLGYHKLNVETTDMHNHVFSDRKLFRVTADPESSATVEASTSK